MMARTLRTDTRMPEVALLYGHGIGASGKQKLGSRELRVGRAYVYSW